MSNLTDDLKQVIEEAGAKIDAAYWAACDAEQRAIDPRDLTDDAWAIDMLDQSYDIALRIESDPLGWAEGRAKF